MFFWTYESTDAPPEKRWCATLRMKGQKHMLTFVFAPTQEAVVDKAKAWIAGQEAKRPPAARAPKTPTPQPEEIEEAI